MVMGTVTVRYRRNSLYSVLISWRISSNRGCCLLVFYDYFSSLL